MASDWQYHIDDDDDDGNGSQVYKAACVYIDDLKRQIASQQSVIEALQMNIADLTGHTARLERVEAGLPAIPSAALQPAKLPRFF